MSLRADLRASEMSEQWPRNITWMLPTTADLYCIVAILFSRLVRNDLYAVELEDGAGSSISGFGIVESSHAFLDC